MSKKKVTLEEAKDILGTDKIFYNGNSKFNVVDAGKYHSGITIEIPQAWTVNKKRKLESPISYKSAKELTDGMKNIPNITKFCKHTLPLILNFLFV